MRINANHFACIRNTRTKETKSFGSQMPPYPGFIIDENIFFSILGHSFPLFILMTISNSAGTDEQDIIFMYESVD